MTNQRLGRSVTKLPMEARNSTGRLISTVPTKNITDLERKKERKKESKPERHNENKTKIPKV